LSENGRVASKAENWEIREKKAENREKNGRIRTITSGEKGFAARV